MKYSNSHMQKDMAIGRAFVIKKVVSIKNL